MEIVKAIKSRQTIRAFKSVPVSRDILQELLETAIRAPSWANTQTWELSVAGGEAMEELRQNIVSKALTDAERQPDIPRPDWPSPYRERTKENGSKLFQLLGIARDDKEKQLDWMVQMHSFFGAPNAIFIFSDKGLSQWSLFNIGLLSENIALAAMQYGLGTAMLASVTGYAEDIKTILNIPQTKQLVIGIAIGYPNMQSPSNSFRSSREPLSSLATWHGF
jgi:nitroreductase